MHGMLPPAVVASAFPPCHLSPAAALPPNSPAPAGAADGTLRVWDRRKTASPAFSFHHHSQAVTVVEWCPQQAGVFSSAGEDRCGAWRGGLRRGREGAERVLHYRWTLPGTLLSLLLPPSCTPPRSPADVNMPAPALLRPCLQAAVHLGPRSQGSRLRGGGWPRSQARALRSAPPNVVPARRPPGAAQAGGKG